VLTHLLDGGWLRPGTLVVVERSARGEEWRWPVGIDADRSRRYGEGALWYGRAAAPETSSGQQQQSEINSHGGSGHEE
jgi:16S rRNA (guanine966-N2)-methyltransferase